MVTIDPTTECGWCGHTKAEHSRISSACLAANCQCYEWHNPPMTAPTTGATEARSVVVPIGDDGVYAIAVDHHPAHWSIDTTIQMTEHGKPYGLSFPLLDGERAALAQALLKPGEAAELRASVRRLKEISEYASAVLILEGDFGRSTAETKRLTALLDARTLPHDWERIDAWLAQQEGGDER